MFVDESLQLSLCQVLTESGTSRVIDSGAGAAGAYAGGGHPCIAAEVAIVHAAPGGSYRVYLETDDDEGFANPLVLGAAKLVHSPPAPVFAPLGATPRLRRGEGPVLVRVEGRKRPKRYLRLRYALEGLQPRLTVTARLVEADPPAWLPGQQNPHHGKKEQRP